MPCYYPQKYYRCRTPNPSGKYGITSSPLLGWTDMPVVIPCGQCIGCRLERSRQWAMRCMHEASLHDCNCFITLTYSDDFLPDNDSLRKSDFQNFMKRLRKKISPAKVRYYMCGEYGSQNNRPHYHALLFGYDFSDAIAWDSKYRISPMLQVLWPYGHTLIGDVTFESAAYVARYCVDKITGDKSEEYYGDRIVPYNCMSRRPGIGYDWYKTYKKDVYPHDEVIVRGRSCKPPKYYDDKLKCEDLKMYRSVKQSRISSGNDEGSLRRQQKEDCKKETIKKQVRREL